MFQSPIFQCVALSAGRCYGARHKTPDASLIDMKIWKIVSTKILCTVLVFLQCIKMTEAFELPSHPTNFIVVSRCSNSMLVVLYCRRFEESGGVL